MELHDKSMHLQFAQVPEYFIRFHLRISIPSTPHSKGRKEPNLTARHRSNSVTHTAY